ncbi:MAG: YihA family ribosome biogenesis GTP-binding protein [Spirochaetales bacterium]|nr:YihA family ribosome biogenesis GTP-binding protein [Spirochaetales bacterium]
MEIKSATFTISSAKLSQCPKDTKAEFAFIGRSNVGKSSLINDLCRKKIAKTSQTPGKTRLINYFTVNNNLLYFVDLPGYGYAQVSKQERASWPKMIEEYLAKSEHLRKVFFLLDIRRMPNEMDKAINDWIKQVPDIEPVYILTKYDKLSKSQAQAAKIKIALELFVDQSRFIFYSVTKNVGRAEVLKQLDEL